MTLVRLGDTARFINGVAFKPSDFVEDGLPIIRIQNLTGTGDSYNRTNRTVRPELVIERGDLLVSWSATLDAYRWGGPKGVLNQHIFKVIPNSGVDADYLYYALKTVIVELQRKTHGSTMKHVVRGDFENTRIRVPPVGEQRRIVELISRAETVVSMRREAEQKAQEIIPALFLDMFGDPVTNSKGWPVRAIEDVADIQGGLQVTGKRVSLALEVPYLRVANVHRTHLDLSEIKLMKVTSAEIKRTRLMSGDLLVIEGHGNPLEVGRVGMWTGAIDPCTHQNHLIRIRCQTDIVNPRYLWTCLNSAGGRAGLLRQGKTTSGLNTISVSNVKSVRVPIPPLAHQQAFAEALERIEGICTLQTRATERAYETFRSLLGGVFQGVQDERRGKTGMSRMDLQSSSDQS